jgi:hypothetical protein
MSKGYIKNSFHKFRKIIRLWVKGELCFSGMSKVGGYLDEYFNESLWFSSKEKYKFNQRFKNRISQ